ncbi:M23 family metallopeptidase [Microbulbifer echini]|uniref:M23 family metallopeptidase n=1 Tax=Microbulbifer echini TaxID=1529067 RepID=A0ABV4NPY6_9GAMM
MKKIFNKENSKKHSRNKVIIVIFTLFGLGFLIPEEPQIPVLGASPSDWNKDTFWYEPWGPSGVHKGIDIFARKGSPAISATNMLILYKGNTSRGGNIVVGLGPKWRIHYFAHLENVSKESRVFISAGSIIGSIGNTGNASGKPAHLHYSIVSLFPFIWKIDNTTQGWKKAFYLNPMEVLKTSKG